MPDSRRLRKRECLREGLLRPLVVRRLKSCRKRVRVDVGDTRSDERGGMKALIDVELRMLEYWNGQ